MFEEIEMRRASVCYLWVIHGEVKSMAKHRHIHAHKKTPGITHTPLIKDNSTHLVSTKTITFKPLTKFEVHFK